MRRGIETNVFLDLVRGRRTPFGGKQLPLRRLVTLVDRLTSLLVIAHWSLGSGEGVSSVQPSLENVS